MTGVSQEPQHLYIMSDDGYVLLHRDSSVWTNLEKLNAGGAVIVALESCAFDRRLAR
ncbi:MAG: hypothetical protein QN120_05085 [Armatimonadota bacterium]|nr:hypothetical protein [Armatimonadota bacterium]